jgi:hypothetical protein
MCCRAAQFTDDSEERPASVFEVEDMLKKQRARANHKVIISLLVFDLEARGSIYSSASSVTSCRMSQETAIGYGLDG